MLEASGTMQLRSVSKSDVFVVSCSDVVSVGSEAASAVVAAVLRVGPLLLPSPYYSARMCTLLQAMLPQMLHRSGHMTDCRFD